MSRLDGKVAVVTGASRGIGAAVCEAFAREGARVVVNYLPTPAMEALARDVVTRIEADGGSALAIGADVASGEDVARLVELTNREFGDVDILVANAARTPRAPWTEIDVDQWDRTLAVNLRGPFLCARSVFPGMVRRGGGSIIAVSSITVDVGMVGMLDYVTSKAGVIGFTRALAREVGAAGVRVNCVMPGAIRTEQELDLDLDEAELAAWAAERQSLPRRGYAEDLAGTFVYLASSDSSFVTGQVIAVDGGWIHR